MRKFVTVVLCALLSIAQVWSHRTDRYSELRGSPEMEGKRKVEMSYIGG